MQIGMFLQIKFAAQGIKAKVSSVQVHEVLRHHLPTAHFTCSYLTYSSSYPESSNTTLQAHFPCTVS